MASQGFVESFGHLYNEVDLASFLVAAYGPEGIVRDLGDTAFSFRAASEGGRIVGYAKLGPLGVPAPQPAPGAIELKQIYVLAPWHGAGVAGELMDWAIAVARERGAPELYLSVFDHNHRAKRFYARYGFEDVGGCIFRVGEQLDEDRMWRRAL
jgi:GNAT superfamily N-acetyltransferase